MVVGRTRRVAYLLFQPRTQLYRETILFFHCPSGRFAGPLVEHRRRGGYERLGVAAFQRSYRRARHAVVQSILDEAVQVCCILGPSNPTMLNPLDHPICLTSPKRVTRLSAWHEHIPFAMFLVDLLRPEGIVELGTESGESY